MKFATKLTVLLLVIILVSGIVISLFVYSSNLKTLEEEIKDRLEDQAFGVMDKIDRNLYERYSNIQMMATDPIISSRNSTPEQITERLIEYRNIYKTYISLSFFDLNRIRIADASGLNLGTQEGWHNSLEDALQGKVSAASDIELSISLNQIVIYFASPVKDQNGEIFGVVVARMPVTKLYEITREAAGIHEKEEEIDIDLVDKNGLLLYSNTNRKGILKDNYVEELEHIQTFKPGAKLGSLFHHTHVSKEESIMVFVHEQGYLDFKGNDWTLLIHICAKRAFAPAVELRNKLIVVLLPIGIISVLIAFLFSVTITRPITKLKEYTDKIRLGNLDQKCEVKSKDEIGELAKSFDEMRIGLKDRNDLLNSLLNTFKGKFGKVATILVRKNVQELVNKNPRIEKILPKSLGISITRAKNLRERERKKN